MNQTHEIERLLAALREIFTRTRPNSVGSVCEHGDEEMRLEDNTQCERDHYVSHLKEINTLASDALYKTYPLAPTCNIRLVNQAPLEDDRVRANHPDENQIRSQDDQ